MLGQPKKTKFSQNTLESMAKDNGENFQKEQVRYIYIHIVANKKSAFLSFSFKEGRAASLEFRILVRTYVRTELDSFGLCAGLKRCGKSCRLRWLNYLRPDIKRGNISPDEEELIIRLHKLLGNRFSFFSDPLPLKTFKKS